LIYTGIKIYVNNSLLFEDNVDFYISGFQQPITLTVSYVKSTTLLTVNILQPSTSLNVTYNNTTDLGAQLGTSTDFTFGFSGRCGGVSQNNDVMNFTIEGEMESIRPVIAAEALMAPADNAEFSGTSDIDILWDDTKITDYLSLTISKITMYSEQQPAGYSVTTDTADDGAYTWSSVPVFNSKCTLEFEAVNTDNMTNSRIFTGNEFTILPEPGLFIIYYFGLWIIYFRRRIGSVS